MQTGAMPDLSARGPLGLKPDKAPRKARKPLPKRSRKREAYMRSEARVEGMAHMERVKALPCVCCGHPPPSAAHHVTGDDMPRNDMRVLPLCWECHQGPHGYHNAKAEWVTQHGPDYLLLDAVAAML
jgi:hypothetical protein